MTRRWTKLMASPALVLCAGVLAAPAHADGVPAGSETVTARSVSATLSWQAGEFGPVDTTLTIARGGAVAFARTIPEVVCNRFCRLTGTDDLDVRDLDGDGEPEVVVTGSTGGMHCCAIMGAFDFRTATGTYGELVHDWRGSGFVLRNLDEAGGPPEFVSHDVRFEELFSSHAGSFPPPAVFEYLRRGGEPRLVDITRLYEGVIRDNATEARRQLRRLHRGDGDAGGFVSAYVADQYLLGRGPVGLRELDRQAARGILGSRRSARSFRRRLLRVLHRYGYR